MKMNLCPLRLSGALVALLLGACASAGTPTTAPQLWLYGEQHDQPDQQRQVAEAVTQLAAAGGLHAVVIEMAERGRTTAALPPRADEAAVREALAWSDGWPWVQYGPVVMAAVQAGVPVLGGNLPRAQMRAAMADAALDQRVTDGTRLQLTDEVRAGHCGLLPESQMAPMVRIQIGRDLALAQTVAATLAAAPPGRAVLVLAGAQHVSRDRGVPTHLDASLGATTRIVMFGSPVRGLVADEWRPSALTERPDPCEALKRQLEAGPTRR